MKRLFGRGLFLFVAIIGLVAAKARAVQESAATTNAAAAAAGVAQRAWGETPGGTRVNLFTLRNAGGTTVRLTDYGATIVAVEVPDRGGAFANVVLGRADLAGYLKPGPHGSTIGRFANRIAGGRFNLDGKAYALAINKDPHHLHGGAKGFDKHVWAAATSDAPDGPSVRFTRRSPDGEEGYPGNLDVAVTFTLTGDDALRIDYVATTDKPTPLNLTNHAYFNLAGADGPAVAPVAGHVLTLHADQYLPTDATQIPTGALAPVAGTPMDFRKPTPIGQRLPQAKGAKGGANPYDHCFVVNGGGKGTLVPVASVTDPASGRRMDVSSTAPGVQLFTGRRTALCLETQHFPDSPNRPEFPNVILRPGQAYRSSTVYRFSIAAE